MQTGQLTVIQSTVDCQDQVFLLQGAQRVLGRSSTCHFQIQDPLISSLHCYFMRCDTQFIAVDLLSSHGMYHNEKLVDQVTLSVGDRIRVGHTTLEFSEHLQQQANKTYITGESPSIAASQSAIQEEVDEPNKNTLGKMIQDKHDLRICRLALKNQLITHEQLRLLLSSTPISPNPSLVETMIAKKWLNADEVKILDLEYRYYKIRTRDIGLGTTLASQKIVLEPQIQECLAVQQQHFQENKEIKRLSEILVEKNYLTVHQNNQIIRALQDHHQAQKASVHVEDDHLD